MLKSSVLIVMVFVCLACDGVAQDATIPIVWEFQASADDSLRLFELAADSSILRTIVTVPAIDTTYVFDMTPDNQRHYFAAKGYLLDEDVWSGFSNIVDTLLVRPPVLWFGKKK